MVAVSLDEEPMDTSQSSTIPEPIITAPELEAPSLSTRVFKDECMFCFHSPFFEGGIYVCLQHYVGLCARHVNEYSHHNGCKYFLRIQKFKVKPSDTDEPKDKIQRLCVLADKDEEEERMTIVVAPNFKTDIPISEQSLDSHFFHVVQAIIRHASASYQNAIDSGVSDWDGGERKLLPDAKNLPQLDVDKVIPYFGWKCEELGCDLTENLWLNLSDGSIMCGRAQYISEGKMSKGSGHAKTHAENSGFPVLVKLGTIHNGDADIYSYAENDSVRDPYLKRHLAHFGLDINKFEKTEKSTLELELDLNQKWEWSRCQEDGVTLENMYGSGFTGLINIGSSCYINSVIQTLLLDPVFVDAYTCHFNTQVSGSQLIDLYDDFNFQLARMVHSLQSGEYAKDGFEHNGIKPTQFRRVAGRGHSEFSTAGQQDAGEYITHLFNKMEETYQNEPNPVDNYRFKVVSCLRDNASQKYLYHNQPHFILPLLIPKDKLSTTAIEEPVVEIFGPLQKPLRSSIDLTTLIDYYKSPQYIEDFLSPVTNENKGAVQTYRLGSFPKFLFVQVNRYQYDDFNQVKKLDVDVNVPDELDLSSLRFEGRKSDEELLPEVEIPTSTRKPEKPVINEEQVQQLLGMGFERFQAEFAIRHSNCTATEDILDWLLAHSDDPGFGIEQPVTPQPSTPVVSKPERPYNDGPSKYKLTAFITHMGSTPHSGHYVCHLQRNGVWYLYNDEKVAVSQNPPKALGYIYLYEQIDSN